MILADLLLQQSNQSSSSPEASVSLPAFLVMLFAATQVTPYLGRFWAAAVAAAEGGAAMIQASVKQRGIQAEMTQSYMEEIKRLFDEVEKRDKLNQGLGEQLVASSKTNERLTQTNLNMQTELRETRENHRMDMERQEQRIQTMVNDSINRELLLKQAQDDAAIWKQKYEEALEWKPKYESEHDRAERLALENLRLKTLVGVAPNLPENTQNQTGDRDNASPS